MGNSLSLKRQKEMKQSASSSDVLIDIIGRLSLEEQFVCISVSQQFHLAAIEALKQRRVLVVNIEHYGWCGTGRKYIFKGSNVRDCGCGRHKLRKTDLIDPVLFKNPTTRGKILVYLPGLKVVHIGSYTKGIYKDLSEYCPDIECIVSKGYYDKLALQPEVTHFSGYVDAASISKLPQVFPKLMSLSLRLDRLSKGNFNEQCFREGITRLKLSEMGDNWPTIFKSPAMKTVKELDMHTWNIHSFGDRCFIAPNLICIDWETRDDKYEEQMTFILKSLCSSPLLQKLNLQPSYTTDPQEVSVSLFTSFNRLKVIKLPCLVEINKILVTVCRNNPLLEDVLVHDIHEDDAYVVLQDLSRLRNLQSLEIINNGGEDEGLSQKHLLEFLAENQTEGQLRFLFTLHQRKDYPGNKDDWPKEMHWNSIKWKFTA